MFTQAATGVTLFIYYNTFDCSNWFYKLKIPAILIFVPTHNLTECNLSVDCYSLNILCARRMPTSLQPYRKKDFFLPNVDTNIACTCAYPNIRANETPFIECFCKNFFYIKHLLITLDAMG